MKKPRQCRSKHILKDIQCQGVPRHEGSHWAYDDGGWLIQWKNKRDKSPEWKGIGSAWIPPGHKRWISPIEMAKYHYLTVWYNETNKSRNAKVRKARKRRGRKQE